MSLKGFNTPTGKKGMSKGMPTAEPKKNLFKAPDLTDRIQKVRPTTMRNLGPWKPGK